MWTLNAPWESGCVYQEKATSKIEVKNSLNFQVYLFNLWMADGNDLVVGGVEVWGLEELEDFRYTLKVTNNTSNKTIDMVK